jgi:hypothetical protein
LTEAHDEAIAAKESHRNLLTITRLVLEDEAWLGTDFVVEVNHRGLPVGWLSRR